MRTSRHPGMVSKPQNHLILARFSNSPWTGRKARLGTVRSVPLAAKGSLFETKVKEIVDETYPQRVTNFGCFRSPSVRGDNIEAYSAGSLRPEWMQCRHPERQLCL